MPFVELDRHFVAVAKDKEPVLNAGSWGRKYLGWKSWPDLLAHRRVVLLAEASSGKTEEFQHQQQMLEAAGKAAFFMRIEELADQGFEAALETKSAERLKQWLASSEEACFFLDSVDEARLNQKSFETALKRFARDLGKAVDRARVYVSCRVTDWKGEKDRTLIERILPSWELATANPTNDDNPLLDPIFKKDKSDRVQKQKEPEAKPHELLVVQLVPLDNEQCGKLAHAFGVADSAQFMFAVEAAGLDAYTERPGDLIELATYWKTHKRFGNLSEMVEYGIAKKLSEEDVHRSDNAALSPIELRTGAEMVAAGLSFTKTFTLRAPGHDPDPSLSVGALNTTSLLVSITPAQRNALLRRGVFSPTTYGRVRFHHRTTQEYLTAAWLGRLLDANCPTDEIWNLIFAERYGVPTTVPSLRPAAAWLSLKRKDIQDELIKRDPLTLLRHGDPRALSLDAKKRLLLRYAEMQAASELADDSLDNRAIAMFAEPALSDQIKLAWKLNKNEEFRGDVLRMVREGKITGCLDLARRVVKDKKQRSFNRIVALQALEACGDTQGLTAAATLLKRETSASRNFKTHFARVLFPRFVAVDDIIKLIDDNPSSERTTDGFDYAATELYEACDSAEMKASFAGKLADLCLAKPFADSWQRVSRKHRTLARNLKPIVLGEMNSLGSARSAEHVVRLLMVAERVDRNYSFGEGPSIRDLLNQNLALKRALFWADVAEVRSNSRDTTQKPIRVWQVFISGGAFWDFGPADLDWLSKDLEEPADEDDKRIVLSAITQILLREDKLAGAAQELRFKFADNALLEADLEDYLKPQVEDQHTKDHRARLEAHEAERKAQEDKDKASWRGFRELLQKAPTLLTDPQTIADWKKVAFRLHDLTRWLQWRTHDQGHDAPLQWRLLSEGFGENIAEAYCKGMKAFWRLSKPERPKHKEGGAITVKYSTILAYEAVGLEASENSEWATKLSNADAKTALGHACLSEQGVPNWLDDLIDAHPTLATAALTKAVTDEWQSGASGRSDFLYYFGARREPLHPIVEALLIKVLSGEKQPDDTNKLDTGLKIIARLSLLKDQAGAFAQAARERLKKNTTGQDEPISMRDIARLLIVEGDKALKDLERWLAKPKPAARRARAERMFAFLFDRHDPVVPGILAKLSVEGLEALLKLAYHYVRPEHDEKHEGVFSLGTRDHAENARNTILGALIERPGADAYQAMCRLALDPDFAKNEGRFRELAHGKAESDCEFPAWTVSEVVAFNTQHLAPIKTGDDLLRVVLAVLADLQAHLRRGDINSRSLFERAKDEDEARNYIVEQMMYRSKDRFHAYREAQIAKKDRPDIIVASTSARCEVGMEVKHGSKGWSQAQLSDALHNQLAEDYLKPVTRRHGVLVITKHGPRRWRDADTHKWLSFDSIISWLQGLAAKITSNSSGAITVHCVGLDATEPK